jgi:hypothetical protein
MGLKRVFSKIGGGILGALKNRKTRRVAAEMARVFVPAWGPALARAIDVVETAEAIFTEPKSGEDKKAWALEQLQAQLAEMGFEEKRILGLIELALLLTKGEATVDWKEEESPEG